MHRPPVFPVIAGSLNLVFGAFGIYLTQAIFHSLSCVLLFDIGSSCFTPRTGFLAALLFALNFIFVFANLRPLSEVTFTLLALGGVRYVLVSLDSSGDDRRLSASLLIAAILFALCILTRPAGLYLPLLCIAAVAVNGISRRKYFATAVQVTLFALVVYLPAYAWTWRNHRATGLAKLTSTDVGMPVYYLGAAAYQIHHGVDREEALQMIQNEFQIPSNHELHNHDFVGGNLSEKYFSVKQAVRPVLKKYPIATIQAGTTGILRAVGSHTAANSALALAMEWNPPGFGRLVKGDQQAFRDVFKNSLALVGIVVWQLMLSGMTLAFAALTALLMLRHPMRYRLSAWLVLLAAGHFLVMPALSAFVASSRAAVPLWPFALVLAADTMSRFVFDRRHHEDPDVLESPGTPNSV
ncbi:ArnT family glycosyltransferase [Stieleria maiorica]|nr:glycosyltransferase family 39 protein [Stieleria maiorica]